MGEVQSIKAPFFIVALPQMSDDSFARKVVMVIEHDEEGAFGFVVNDPIRGDKNSINQLKLELQDFAGDTQLELSESLFLGGPVQQDNIFAVHDIKELGNPDLEFGKGIYLANNPDVFPKLIENKTFANRRKFFLGSSSWGAGQLDVELRCGSWLIVEFKKEFIFDPVDGDISLWQDQLWRKVSLSGGCDPLSLMGPSIISDAGVN